MRNKQPIHHQSLGGTPARKYAWALGLAFFFGGPLWAQTTDSPDSTLSVDRDEPDSTVGQRELEHSQRRVQDQVITTMVETRLMSDPDIDALRLQVQTQQGNVTLRGPIPDDEHAERAVALARQVDGVRSVDIQQGQPPPEAR